MIEKNFDEYRRTIYNSARWKRLRSYILSTHPFCAICKDAYTTDIDHIIPLQEICKYEGDPYDVENLRGLCKKCHGKKSYTEGLGEVKKKQAKIKEKVTWLERAKIRISKRK